MKNKTCCFFGHRKINDTAELRIKLYDTIEKLIADENVDTFLFGSKSEFNSLCHEIVTRLKEKYPKIKRVYVRAEYPLISDKYELYILEDYEDTYFPEHMINAGKASYVERNYYMIDESQVCVVYYSPDYAPPCRKSSRQSVTYCQPKSGTKYAYEYARKKQKIIINVLEQR